MAGINTDISSEPYPDNFTISGTHAVGIFANTSPRTGLAGSAHPAQRLQGALLRVGLPLHRQCLDDCHGQGQGVADGSQLAECPTNLLWLSTDVTNVAQLRRRRASRQRHLRCWRSRCATARYLLRARSWQSAMIPSPGGQDLSGHHDGHRARNLGQADGCRQRPRGTQCQPDADG